MVTKVRFMYFLLMYIMLIFSSCGDDGNEDWENGDKNTSQTEFKLSPQLLGIIPNIFPNVKDSMYFCRISDTD